MDERTEKKQRNRIIPPSSSSYETVLFHVGPDVATNKIYKLRAVGGGRRYALVAGKIQYSPTSFCFLVSLVGKLVTTCTIDFCPTYTSISSPFPYCYGPPYDVLFHQISQAGVDSSP